MTDYTDNICDLCAKEFDDFTTDLALCTLAHFDVLLCVGCRAKMERGFESYWQGMRRIAGQPPFKIPKRVSA